MPELLAYLKINGMGNMMGNMRNGRNGYENELNTDLDDMYRIVECDAAQIIIPADGYIGTSAYPPNINGFTPIICTATQTGTYAVYCYGITAGVDNKGAYFFLSLRNTINVDVITKPSVRVLYIRKSSAI